MPTYSETALRELIAQGETTTCEFKIAPPRPTDLAERLCGMANAQGGVVIIGIEDATLRIAGVRDIPAAVDVLLRAAHMCHPPVVFEPFEPEVYRLPEGAVIVAHIPASTGPLYQSGGVCWVRRGTRTTALSVSEIAAILQTSGTVKWELQAARKTTLADLDTTKIEDYFRQRDAPVFRFDDVPHVLLGMDCAVRLDSGEIRPTHAGILFFGRDPARIIPQSEAVCVLFRDEFGVGGYIDRKAITGTLPEIITGIVGFIEAHMRVGGRIVDWTRIDIPEYPRPALREAVVNAVVHRDYSRDGESVRVFMYPDRIEIHNPGLLMPGITVDALSRGEVPSRLRNPVLANLLRDLPGYMERIGSGVRLMVRETQRAGLPAPEFLERSEVVVTFRKREVAAENIPVSLLPAPDMPATGTIQPVTDAADAAFEAIVGTRVMAQKQRLILALRYVKTHGGITNREQRELTGASENSATRDLELLVERGALRSVGKTRNRRYELP